MLMKRFLNSHDLKIFEITIANFILEKRRGSDQGTREKIDVLDQQQILLSKLTEKG